MAKEDKQKHLEKTLSQLDESDQTYIETLVTTLNDHPLPIPKKKIIIKRKLKKIKND
jgi:hypothetical protein